MIQRVQSIYLFLALIVLGVVFSRLPIAMWTSAATQNSGPVNETLHVAEEILIGLSAFITFAAIFLYANRKRQMLVVKVAMALTFTALTVFAIDYVRANGLKMEDATVSFDLAGILAVVALILQWLGHRGIAKDEKLVREADRLR